MIFCPYAYQKAAIQWVLDKPRCALFMDMGLGKTVSTLTAVLQLMDDGEVEKTLVVAPKKVAERRGPRRRLNGSTSKGFGW